MNVEMTENLNDSAASGQQPDIAAIKQRFDAVRTEVARVLVGQDRLVERLLLAFVRRRACST